MKATNAIVKELVPVVDKKLKDPKILKNYKALVAKFISDRSSEIYDTAPMTRIYYREEDANALFSTMNIDKAFIKEIINKTYYGKQANFHPAYAKDELTILALTIYRYFYIIKKDSQLEEMSILYLIFSGKMYPSVHYSSFPEVQPIENAHVMNYVVSNMSNQFELKETGSVGKALLLRTESWKDRYKDKFKSYEDDDVVYIIQQLRDRLKNFMQNIAELFYEAYENKHYLAFSSDDISEDNYRLADNNSYKIERYVERAMNDITSKGIDTKIVLLSKNQYVSQSELSSIIETIIDQRENIPIIRELITIMITEYVKDTSDTNISNIAFINHAIVRRPNSANKNIIRKEAIIDKWLDENSPAFRKRKNRLATKLAYQKAVASYFVLVVHNASKGM